MSIIQHAIYSGPLTCIYLSRRGDVPDLTADPALAEKELGFKAKADLETMCRDLWNWQTRNPYGFVEEQPNSQQEPTKQ